MKKDLKTRILEDLKKLDEKGQHVFCIKVICLHEDYHELVEYESGFDYVYGPFRKLYTKDELYKKNKMNYEINELKVNNIISYMNDANITKYKYMLYPLTGLKLDSKEYAWEIFIVFDYKKQ